MKAFFATLLVTVSSALAASAYDGSQFPGKGSQEKYRQSVPWANKGMDFLNQGNFKQALDSFEKSLAIYPLDAGVHSSKGVALSGLSRHSEAISEMKKAVQLEPRWGSGYNNLACEQVLVGDYKNARINCNFAIKFQPNDPQNILTLSELYIATKRLKEARQLINRASKMKPLKGQEQELKQTLIDDLSKLAAAERAAKN